MYHGQHHYDDKPCNEKDMTRHERWCRPWSMTIDNASHYGLKPYHGHERAHTILNRAPYRNDTIHHQPCHGFILYHNRWCDHMVAYAVMRVTPQDIIARWWNQGRLMSHCSDDIVWWRIYWSNDPLLTATLRRSATSTCVTYGCKRYAISLRCPPVMNVLWCANERPVGGVCTRAMVLRKYKHTFITQPFQSSYTSVRVAYG